MIEIFRYRYRNMDMKEIMISKEEKCWCESTRTCRRGIWTQHLSGQQGVFEIDSGIEIHFVCETCPSTVWLNECFCNTSSKHSSGTATTPRMPTVMLWIETECVQLWFECVDHVEMIDWFGSIVWSEKYWTCWNSNQSRWNEWSISNEC